MFRWFISQNEKELADRLRREAIESRPDFSEELHVRLWHALERDALGRGPIQPRPVASRRLRYWATAALATAGILCVAVIGWRPRDVALRPQAAAGGAAETDIDVVAGLADHVSTRLDTLLTSAVTTQRWAYLDHDARLAMQLLADRLPSEPDSP